MKKASAILWFLLCLAGVIHGQGIDVDDSVRQSALRGIAMVDKGLAENTLDTIVVAIPLLEKCLDQTCFSDDEYWEVLRCLSSAYFVSDNIKIRDLESRVFEYYQQDENKPFPQYYYVLEPLFGYYLNKQDYQGLTRVAEALHDAATTTGEQSMMLSSCKYMMAISVMAKGDRWKAMEWLEDSYAVAQPYKEESKYGRLYGVYLDMESQLAQGYMMKGEHDKALAINDELIQGTEDLYGKVSLQHINALQMRYELFSRLAKNNEMFQTGDVLDTVCSVAIREHHEYAAALPNVVAYLRQRKNNYTNWSDEDAGQTEKNTFQLAEEMINHGALVDAKNKVEDELLQMEEAGSLDFYYYNQFLLDYTALLFYVNDLSGVKGILEHAEGYIHKQYVGVAYPTRVVEFLLGEVDYRLGNMSQAKRHFIQAIQMFELANDHGNHYLTCIAYSIDIFFSTQEFATMKLILDELMEYNEKNQTEQEEEENTTSAILSSAYYLLGYKDVSRQQLETLMAKGGMYRSGSQWDIARRLWAMLLIEDGEYQKAAEVLQNNMQLTSNVTERMVALCELTGLGTVLNDPSAIRYLRDYFQLLTVQMNEVMGVFPELEKQFFWKQETGKLVGLSGLVLDRFMESEEARTLAYDIALYVKSMQDRTVSNPMHWREVQSMLSEHEVAIEFVATSKDFIQVYNSQEARYGALLLRSQGEPSFVDLCPVDSVDAFFLSVLHTDKNMINSLFSDKDTRIYDLVWKDIEKYLEKGDTICYSPVGMLGRLNHGALGNGSVRLSDCYSFHQVSTSANVAAVKNRQWQKGGKAVVYGGIDYDEETDEMVEAAKPYKNNELYASRSLSNQGAVSRRAIEELSGTLEEALAIKEVLEGKGYEVRLLEGTEANEESLKALSGSAPEILHIGTHGFMLSTNRDQEQHINLVGQQSMAENPQKAMMLHCGLLMAGARNAWLGKEVPAEIEDGIVTAFELSQIDLAKCGLVVLSACESGLGYINTYLGEIGLKKALKIAGVQTIIASLWEVPDDATSLLMQAMYKEIADGVPPCEALLKAQETVRASYPDPYFWAGFIVED